MEAKKIKKRKKVTAKAKFTRARKFFQAGLARGDDIDVLKDVLKDMENAYENVEEKHADYAEELDSEDESEKIQIDETYEEMEEMYTQLTEARASQVKLVKKKAGESSMVVVDETSRSHVNDAQLSAGEFTEYPSFTRWYRVDMQPVYRAEPYVTQKCSHCSSMSAIQGSDDNIEAIMSHIDLNYDLYDLPDNFSNAIVSELKGLKPILEGDDEKFIQLVDTVVNCWLEMKILELNDERSSLMIVSEVERLLPKTILKEWAVLKEKLRLSSIKDQFPHILKFLLRKKIAMGYMDHPSSKKDKALKAKILMIAREEGDDKKDRKADAIEMLLKNQKRSDATLRKILEGLAKVIEAFSKNRSNSDVSSTESVGSID